MEAFYVKTVDMSIKLKFIKKIFHFQLLLLALVLPFSSIKSQTISYPVAANPISVSYDSTTLTVQVSGASANPTITITLPTGVFYIPSSFTFTSGSGTVIPSGTTAAPVFTLSGATNPFIFLG